MLLYLTEFSITTGKGVLVQKSFVKDGRVPFISAWAGVVCHSGCWWVEAIPGFQGRAELWRRRVSNPLENLTRRC